MDRSGKPEIPTPWAKFSSTNLVDHSTTHWIRFNKIVVMKILLSLECVLERSTRFVLENFAHGVGI